jgi:hypothetical protein
MEMEMETDQLCQSVAGLTVSDPVKAPRRLPKPPAPADVGRKRTLEFLGEMIGAPKKTRRLDIVIQLQKLEKEHVRIMDRIRKRKERLREAVAALEEDETRRAEIENSIHKLKLEDVSNR